MYINSSRTTCQHQKQFVLELGAIEEVRTGFLIGSFHQFYIGN